MENKWHHKAKEFTKLGRLNVALHCWTRALEEDPEDAEAWAFKGSLLEKTGKHDDAVECYTEAIKINPCFALAWYNKGAILGNYGRYREALGCFMEAKRQGHPSAETAAAACRSELGEDTWVKKPNPVVQKHKTDSTKRKRRGLW